MDCSDGGCLTAAVMFGVDGVRVLAAGEVGHELHLLVETVPQVEGCRSCGVVAVPHRRREHLLRDAPFGHRPVVVMWRKRMFRCAEPACPVGTFSEEHPLAAQRAALTGRAITWAVDALESDDTTVSALARRLGVGWHRCGAPLGSRPPRGSPALAASTGSTRSASTSTCGDPAGSAPAGTSR